jgi:hypothetical protein
MNLPFEHGYKRRQKVRLLLPANLQEMFVISLSSFVIKSITTTNSKFDQSVFAIHDSPPHILYNVGDPRPRLLMDFQRPSLPKKNWA